MTSDNPDAPDADVRRVLDALARETPARRSMAEARMRTLVEALGASPAPQLPRLVQQVGDLLDADQPDRMWLALSVLSGEIPELDRMKALLRRARLEGVWAALLSGVRRARPGRVRVLEKAVVCDIHHTSSTDYVSGIQRVARAVAVRWAEERPVQFVGWNDDVTSMRALDPQRHRRIFGDTPAVDEVSDDIVVPWRGVYVTPELAADPGRTPRLTALAKYSGNQVGMIGYDCIPLTTSSSVEPGMVERFARYLGVCREVHRIAAISDAAGGEFGGWRRMLAGVRAGGPRVGVATLPVAAPVPSDVAVERARLSLGVTSVPMVLVVGSHEPRKNHLAVLHAAELLWREGVRFSLTFVGAGAWKADAFEAGVARLRSAGRAVRAIRGLPDEELWAAFALAHCTLFPSLNEGFGLPVAESLAAGTPVITSDFGSTRDIVAPHGVALGGLLVDPRDDHAVADALRTMLTDGATYQRLKAETSQHELGDWDEYAREVWRVLVE